MGRLSILFAAVIVIEVGLLLWRWRIVPPRKPDIFLVVPWWLGALLSMIASLFALPNVMAMESCVVMFVACLSEAARGTFYLVALSGNRTK